MGARSEVVDKAREKNLEKKCDSFIPNPTDHHYT